MTDLPTSEVHSTLDEQRRRSLSGEGSGDRRYGRDYGSVYISNREICRTERSQMNRSGSPIQLDRTPDSIHGSSHSLSAGKGTSLCKSHSIEELLEKYAPSVPVQGDGRGGPVEGCAGKLRYTLALTGAKYGANPMLSPNVRSLPVSMASNRLLDDNSISSTYDQPRQSWSYSVSSRSEGSNVVEDIIEDTNDQFDNGDAAYASLSPSDSGNPSSSSPNIYSRPENISLNQSDFEKGEGATGTTITHAQIVYKSNSAGELGGRFSKCTAVKPEHYHCSRFAKLGLGSLDTVGDGYPEFSSIDSEGRDLVQLLQMTTNNLQCESTYLPSEASMSGLHSLNTFDSISSEVSPTPVKDDVSPEGLTSGQLKPDYLGSHGRTSRKSSSADSAIDLRAPLSDEDHSESPVPSLSMSASSSIFQTSKSIRNTTDSLQMELPGMPGAFTLISQLINEDSKDAISKRFCKETEDTSTEPEKAESALSPRIPFSQVQTPSFTQIIPPPSVIISDHSHESPASQSNVESPTSDGIRNLDFGDMLITIPLQRKLSNSSINSDRSDSTQSMLSDSSYSIDDEDFEYTACTETKPKVTSVSVYLILSCTLYNKVVNIINFCRVCTGLHWQKPELLL